MTGYEKLLAGVFLLGAIGACAGEGVEDRAARAGDTLPQTGSSYTRDGDSAMMIEGTATSSMLTAPAIISPVRLSLGRMSANPQAGSDPNRSAHKSLLGDLVAAMQTDLNRLGISDNGDLQALGDSVVNQVGGGAGAAEGPEGEDVAAHVAQVERLIELYETKVRTSGAAPDSSAPR